MIRKLIALCFVLLFFAGLASAQERLGARRVPAIVVVSPNCWPPFCTLTRVQASWAVPTKKPDSYRISWTTTNKWRKKHRPNTLRQGNAIVTETRYIIDHVHIPPGKTLRIRVRARYDNGKNGRWNCCVERKP